MGAGQRIGVGALAHLLIGIRTHDGPLQRRRKQEFAGAAGGQIVRRTSHQHRLGVPQLRFRQERDDRRLDAQLLNTFQPAHRGARFETIAHQHCRGIFGGQQVICLGAARRACDLPAGIPQMVQCGVQAVLHRFGIGQQQQLALGHLIFHEIGLHKGSDP